MKTGILMTMLLLLQLDCGIYADDTDKSMELKSILTPNAAALAQYGIIPMSLYTGKANISIPIYNTSIRGIDCNIKLLYDTSGLLLNSLPSWTGHSWTLDVGGVITRTIKGRPDEFDKTNHNFVGKDLWQNYFHRYNANINNSSEQWGDFMPDVFYFNFMGKSGKFFLGNDGEWKVASDDNLMVEFDINNPHNYVSPFIDVTPNKHYYQPRSIKGFTILDQDGNKYVFGGSQDLNAIEYSIDLREDNDGAVVKKENHYTISTDINGEMYSNSWYLTAVYDRFGKLIYNFEYERGLFLINTINQCYSGNFPQMMINSPVYLKKITTYDGTEIHFIRGAKIFTSKDYYYRLYQHFGNNLKKMYEALCNQQIGSNRFYNFVYLTDPTYSKYQNPDNTNKQKDPLNSMGFSPLKEIRIIKRGILCQKHILNYTYSDNVRLHLNGITTQDGGGATDGEYKFVYNHFEELPTIGGHCDYLSSNHDHWGYYNGTSENNEVDPTYSQYGMLTEIHYPTGGITTLKYNNHYYAAFRNECHDGMVYLKDLENYDGVPLGGVDHRIAGGLRVININNYNNARDLEQQKAMSEHHYDYEDGQLATIPSYYIVVNPNGSGDFSAYTPVPMANIFGTHIGYSKVLEEVYTAEREVQKLYEYSNFSGYKEESCWKNLSAYRGKYNSIVYLGWSILAAFDEWTSRDYMKGRLLHFACRSEDDTEWSSVTYTYRTDSINREKNCVIGYVDQGNSHAGRALSNRKPAEYRLFYPKYDVEKKIEKVKYDWFGKYTTDVTTYNMRDYDITISNGYNHKGYMRLCESEIKSRLGENIQRDYTYKHFGYYAPVVGKKVYRNGTLVENEQVLYNSFTIDGKTIQLPKKEIVCFSSNDSTILKTYNSYNSSYLPTEYLDRQNRTVKLKWDTYDHLLSESIGNQITTFEYNSLGLVSKIIQPNSYQLLYEYDNMQRLSGVRDGKGCYLNKYKYSYRMNGNMQLNH